jgi:8-oxo-dGTP diphosphatase
VTDPAASLPDRVEVAAGLIFRGSYLLISRRFPEAHAGGLWEFPGGAREPGESLEECLVREIREELDLTVRVGRHLMSVEHSYPDKNVTLHFYYCVPQAGTPTALGCQEFRWITLGELEDYEFPGADRPVLDQLKTARGM